VCSSWVAIYQKVKLVCTYEYNKKEKKRKIMEDLSPKCYRCSRMDKRMTVSEEGCDHELPWP
jgi:hypothetical protein